MHNREGVDLGFWKRKRVVSYFMGVNSKYIVIVLFVKRVRFMLHLLD